MEMCLRVVECSLAMRNYLHVNTYAAKAESVASLEKESKEHGLVLARLRPAVGAAHIAAKRYLQAARLFSSLSPELADERVTTSSVSPVEIAIYGTLCAFATMDRSEFIESIADNPSFRCFVSRAPEEILLVIESARSAQYGDALKAIERLRERLHYDIFLSSHVPFIVEEAKSRSLVEYAKAFETLDLHRMASVFDCDVV